MKVYFCKLILTFVLVGFNMLGCSKKEEAPQQPSTESAPVAADQGSGAAVAVATTGTAVTPAADASKAQAVDLSVDTAGLSKAVAVIKTSKGVIKFKFYSKDAPNTVKRLVELIQSKYYNGLRFHRVVPGFVAQTGDPKSKNKDDQSVGTGGSGTKLKAEFNGRKHVRGTLAMARTKDPNSADSQFYITMGVFPHLDNTYTVFGMVSDFGERVQGQDVLDRLTIGDEILDLHIE